MTMPSFTFLDNISILTAFVSLRLTGLDLLLVELFRKIRDSFDRRLSRRFRKKPFFQVLVLS